MLDVGERSPDALERDEQLFGAIAFCRASHARLCKAERSSGGGLRVGRAHIALERATYGVHRFLGERVRLRIGPVSCCVMTGSRAVEMHREGGAECLSGARDRQERSASLWCRPDAASPVRMRAPRSRGGFLPLSVNKRARLPRIPLNRLATFHAHLIRSYRAGALRHLVPLGGDAARDGVADARSPPDHRRPDDARARLPEEGLHRAEAHPRERAAHLHPRGRARGSGSATTRRRKWSSARARCCTSRRTCLTRPRRSRTRSTSTFSPPRQDWLNKTDSYLRK